MQLLTATLHIENKIKEVILLKNTLTIGYVFWGNITLFDFCCFLCI